MTEMSTKNYANPNDRRNIIDYYHYWTNEAIKADLDTKRHPFAVLCCNIGGDYNLSTIVRCCNAFLAERIFIFGRKKWDKRGAVGTYNYERITYLPEEEDLDCLKDYTWVGVDNIPSAVPVEDFSWPDRPLLCFGEEQIGLQKSVLDRCKELVYIKQYGSVRSLNVGVAAGIIMQDYTVKYSKKSN